MNLDTKVEKKGEKSVLDGEDLQPQKPKFESRKKG